MQVGLDLVYWQSVAPRAELLALAAASGCDAVNLALTPGFCDPTQEAEVEATRARVMALGLAVPSLTVPRHVACVPGAEAEFRACFALCASLAPRFDAHVLAVWPHRPEGVSPEVAKAKLAENMQAVLPLAEAAGCVIALEFEPGVTIERYAEAAVFVDGIDPRVQLTADTYHIHRAGDDLYEATRTLGPRLADLHLSGSHRGEPGSPGDECDYVGFLRGAREAGYDGALILQYRIPPDPAESLQRAVAVTRRALAEAG